MGSSKNITMDRIRPLKFQDLLQLKLGDETQSKIMAEVEKDQATWEHEAKRDINLLTPENDTTEREPFSQELTISNK